MQNFTFSILNRLRIRFIREDINEKILLDMVKDGYISDEEMQYVVKGPARKEQTI